MKIYIVSDTHGKTDFIINEILYNNDADRIIHLGDVVEDADEIEKCTNIEVISVAGNNDYFTNVESDKLIIIDNKKIFLTHGHNYGVYCGYEILIKKAKSIGADIVLFGHTHVRTDQIIDGIRFINPGSLSYPRSHDHKKSYAIMDIDGTGINVKFVYMN